MSLTGKIDVSLKFNQLPNQIVDSGQNKEFLLNADGIEVTVRIHSKALERLHYANEKYPSWVALLEGKTGSPTDSGFILEQSKLQVFEKKAKVVEENQ